MPHGGDHATRSPRSTSARTRRCRRSRSRPGEGGGGACDRDYGCSYGDTISFRTPTSRCRWSYNPRKLFHRLFGQGDTPSERECDHRARPAAFSTWSGEAAALQRSSGARDRVRVDDYLDSVREIERRVQKLGAAGPAKLDVPDAPVGVPDDFDEHMKLMFDLIALAYPGQPHARRTFMMAAEVSMRTYNHVGVSDAFHPLSHHAERSGEDGRSSRDPDVSLAGVRQLPRQAREHAGWRRLAARPLDHPVRQQHEQQRLAQPDPLPQRVFGHGYGRIKGGQHLHYPQDTPHANLLLTLLERAGVPVETIGDSTASSRRSER